MLSIGFPLLSFVYVVFMKVIQSEPLNLYITRKEIPLVIGFSKSAFFVSSDYNTFSEYVEKYFELKNNDILCLSYDPINDNVN